MSNLGEVLRERRKEKKLSIDEVAEKLRIRNKYLIQIEDNDIDPSNVYVQGYIKNYANFLKVDVKEYIIVKKPDIEVKKEVQTEDISDITTTPSLKVVSASILAIVASILAVIYMSNIDFSVFSLSKKESSVINDSEMVSDITSNVKKDFGSQKNKDSISEENVIDRINSFQIVVKNINKDYKVIVTANSPVEVSIFDIEGELVSRERLDLGEDASFFGKDHKELKFITNAPKAIDITFDKIN